MIPIPLGTTPQSDRMARLLSELQAATATTKEHRRGFWIGIHSTQWKSILGRHYHSIIAEAERLGFVEVNHRYSVGRFCKSIRLAEKFRTPETSQYRPKRTRSDSDGHRVRLEPSDVVGHKLAACFDAVAIPENVVAQGWDSFCVNSIRNRSWYCVRCPYRRLHTSFTGLPKQVRSCLSIDSKTVVERDVANCQPLILGLLATATQNTTHRPYTICGAKTLSQGDGKRYLRLCENGQLYEYLQARFESKNQPSREQIKRQFLVLLFADNTITKRIPLFRVVAREFPTIAAFIVATKRDQYQRLAHDCQRFESSLMIDRVAANLVKRFPIVTIHDSIVAPIDCSNEVENEVVKQFGLMGVAVTVRQTKLDQVTQ